MVDGLIDSWCERRALRALRTILQGYPFVSGLSDEWFRLRDNLRFIRAECIDDLFDEEADRLERAISLVDAALVPFDH